MLEEVEKNTNTKLAKTSNPYEALSDDEKLLVDMRVYRHPMTMIAKRSNLNYSYVRQLFMEGGRLYEAYIYRVNEVREEYREHLDNLDSELKELAVEAIETLKRVIKYSKNEMAKVMASRDILDRTGITLIDKPEDDHEESEEPVQIYLPDNNREKLKEHRES